MSSEKNDLPNLVELAAMREMGLLGGNKAPAQAKPAPQPVGIGRVPSAELLEAQERERLRSEATGDKGSFLRNVAIGTVAGLIAAFGIGTYKDYRAENATTEAFRAAAREATSAIGLGHAVYKVNAPQGACLHWVNEARDPINPVQCLPTGTLVRGIVAPPTRTDVAEARQWLLVSLTNTEVRTGRTGTANEFPQGYLVPYTSVRPLTGAAASGSTPKQ